MYPVDINTKEFYKELNNGCDIKKLESIAEKGIFLYEPLIKYDKIKDTESCIKISFNAFQIVFVNNIQQYNIFIELANNFYQKYLLRTFIPNEYIIKTLINDTSNIDKVEQILKQFDPVVLFFYFFEYNIISYNEFKVFEPSELDDKSLILIYCLNYFYLNKNFYEIKKLLNFIDKNILIGCIIFLFGRDTNILNYIIDNLINEKLILNRYDFYNIPLMSSLEIIKNKNIDIKDAELLNENSFKRVYNERKYFQFENKNLFDINFLEEEEIKLKNDNKKIKDCQNRVNNFINKHYSNVLNDYYYYDRNYVYNEDIFKEDLNELLEYFKNNIELYPFGKELFSYYDLHIIMFSQLFIFRKKYLSGIDSSFLEDSDHIIQLANKYRNNYVISLLLKVCYIISLIYNNRSIHVIRLFIRYTNLSIILKKKHIVLKYSCDTDFEYHIGNILTKIDPIRNYLKLLDTHGYSIIRKF
ncbi:hypothetical protein U3516DRAFT_808336 [Neocallimastix sp. 'constans']